MTKKYISRAIAYNIVMAQLTSDYAKRITWEALPKNGKNSIRGEKCNRYQHKDIYIQKAIELIAKSGKERDFNFYVVEAPDQNGNLSFVTYFSYVINGKSRQISFHGFNKAMKKFVGKGKVVAWDHGSSHLNAIELANYFGMI